METVLGILFLALAMMWLLPPHEKSALLRLAEVLLAATNAVACAIFLLPLHGNIQGWAAAAAIAAVLIYGRGCRYYHKRKVTAKSIKEDAS